MGVPVHKFDTKVQHLKYKVLREVARQAWNDTLTENLLNIPQIIIPGKEAATRATPTSSRSSRSPATNVPWAAMK